MDLKIVCDIKKEEYCELLNFVEKGNVLLIKKCIDPNAILRMRDQLMIWSKETPPSVDHYPDAMNMHIKLDYKPALQTSLDYKEDEIPHNMHNYRFGDIKSIREPALEQSVSAVATPLMNFYYNFTGRKDLEHGNSAGKNLYFEVMHFPCNIGGIGKHTHDSILKNGQIVNPILMASEMGTDFESGSLWIDGPNGEHFDLRDEMECGDLVMLKNDIVHGVHPVKGHDESAGRWTMTLIYYDKAKLQTQNL